MKKKKKKKARRTISFPAATRRERTRVQSDAYFLGGWPKKKGKLEKKEKREATPPQK